MPRQKTPAKEFVWTPKLAYVVGLLVTDGNLSKDGRHITMRSSDKCMLVTFKKCLRLENKIGESYDKGKEKPPSYRVQFCNIQFYKWLISIGVEPAKTHTISKIKIPKEFFIDFLRGHLDGDGTILTYQDKYNVYKGKRYTNTRVYTYFISASEKHIKWLHGMLKRCTGISGALIYRKPNIPNRVPMWQIKIAKYESLKLFKQLYYQKNLPTLDRKRAIAERLLNNVNADSGKLVCTA